jgi:transmembrane sensor
VRLHDAPGDVSLRAGFADWLAQSEVHARAWAQTRQAWTHLGQVLPEFAHEWPRRIAFARPLARRGSRRRALAAAAGLAACLLLALGLSPIRVALLADHATAVAETRQIALADGSTVHLGASSAIDVRFSDGRRRVTLLRGEAFFEVTPDHARPFSVRAADLDVTVTGTAFDVGFTENSFAVAVARGAVRVSRAGLGATGSVDLAPGQGLIIDRKSGTHTDTTPAPRTIAAWRGGQLIVENMPLTEVVAQLGRYHPGLILVADDALRDKRVTGGYDLHDPQSALRLLVAPYGGTVRAYTPWMLVLSAR